MNFPPDFPRDLIESSLLKNNVVDAAMKSTFVEHPALGNISDRISETSWLGEIKTLTEINFLHTQIELLANLGEMNHEGKVR